MSDRTWAKIGAGTGLGFVLLLVLGYILGPNDPPGFGGDIAGFVSANGDEISTAASLYGGSLFLFAFFIGAIAANNRANDREGRLSAAGHAGAIAALVAGSVSIGAALTASSAIDQGSTGGSAAWIFGDFAFLGVLGGFAVLALATGKIALKSNGKSLPEWLGAFSVVVALLLGVVTIVAISTRTGAFSPYDGELVRISFLALALWSVAVSAELLRKVK